MKKGFKLSLFYIFTLFLFACNSKQDDSTLFRNDLSVEDSAIVKSLDDKIQLRQFDEFFVELDSIKKTNKYQNLSDLRITITLLEAQALSRLNRYQESLVILNKLLDECNDKERYRSYSVNANLLKGEIYYRLGNYQVAYNYLYESKVIGELYNSECDMAKYDYRIGKILYAQEKYAEAIHHFRLSYDKYNSCISGFPVDFRKQELISNVGICYYKLGIYDSSIYYYNQALDILSTINPIDSAQAKYLRMAFGVIKGNTGKSYIAKKRNDLAIPLLKYNIDINTRPNLDYNDALTSVIALSELYLNQNDYKNFVNTVSIADKYVDSMHSTEYMSKIYKLKSKYYENIKDFEKSVYYLNKHILINDSLIKINQNLKNADLLISIESLEKENELNKLKQSNALNSLYLTISILIGLFLIVGCVFFYILYQKYKTKQLKLEAVNQQVLEQSDLLHHANDEIQRNIESLRKREVEKNRIMNMIAIDLQNPNARVISLISNLLNSGKIEEDERKTLNEIHHILLNNNDLIQEILLFSKNNNKADARLALEVIHCNTILTQVIDTNYFKAKQKNIELLLKYSDADAMIHVNQEKIRRAISNLVLNAIKFSNRNTKISLFTTSTKETVNIHIKDEGIGIPDRMKPFIFDSDPLIRRIGTEGEPTFGLGLTLVKQIVEDHNGHITFNSDTKGSEFIITLPLHKSDK